MPNADAIREIDRRISDLYLQIIAGLIMALLSLGGFTIHLLLRHRQPPSPPRIIRP